MSVRDTRKPAAVAAEARLACVLRAGHEKAQSRRSRDARIGLALVDTFNIGDRFYAFFPTGPDGSIEQWFGVVVAPARPYDGTRFEVKWDIPPGPYGARKWITTDRMRKIYDVTA